MPGTPIEFVEPDEPVDPVARHDPGRVTRVRSPRARGFGIGLAVAVVAACGTVVVLHGSDDVPVASAPSTPPPEPSSPSRQPVPAPPPPSVPPDPVGRVAARPIAAATAAVCTREPRCAISRDDGLARAARRALGDTVDLQERRVAPGRAVIVSALAGSGARLFVLVTAPSVKVDPLTLHVRPPFGRQSQRNGRDNVMVLTSGTPASVALLSRPAVQQWISTLRVHP